MIGSFRSGTLHVLVCPTAVVECALNLRTNAGMPSLAGIH